MFILQLFSLILGALLSLYTIYWGLTIVTGGIEVLGRGRDDPPTPSALPMISVAVAVKNEEEVVGRLVEALGRFDYPKDRFEAVFVEDGSTDGTLERLRELASSRSWMRVRHLRRAGSKAAALNIAMNDLRGDLIYVVDADTIPEEKALLKIAGMYSSGYRVMAGYYRILNAREGTIPRMTVFEEFLWRLMCVGRSRLGLACPLPGFNFAIERKFLIEVGGFKEGVLAEDAELTVRLASMGVRPAFFDGYVWLSAPVSVHGLLKQRIRWYRGYLDSLLSNARRLLSAPFKHSLDMTLLFSSPIFTLLGLVNMALAPLALQAMMTPFLAASLTAAAALIVLSAFSYAMRRAGGYYARDSRLVPMIIPYGLLLTAAAIIAVFKHMFRSKRVWERARHSTYVDVSRISGAT